MIERTITKELSEAVDFKKAIILKGARQVGKTTLIKTVLKGEKNVLWIDGDDPVMRTLWGNIAKTTLRQFIAESRFVVFDEAQRIENIGLAIKMILDMDLGKQVIVSGSSSLDLASSLDEPLTGRKWNYNLFPFSWGEIVGQTGLMAAIQQTEQLLIFGAYPEVFTAKNRKQRRLEELAGSYLYRDVLEHGDIRKPELLVKLLKALAFQVGSEVSFHELANMLRVSHETIQRYIGLLEDSFVLFRLDPLSTNPRKEISTSRKIYFYDNGIRNALIGNFNPLENRNDIGQLWENFLVSEMLKKQKNELARKELYFWRNKNGAEVDLVLKDINGTAAYEIKYNPKSKARFAPSFLEKYEPKTVHVLHRENFYESL